MVAAGLANGLVRVVVEDFEAEAVGTPELQFIQLVPNDKALLAGAPRERIGTVWLANGVALHVIVGRQ